MAIGAQMALAFDLVRLKEHAESEEQLKERALALLDPKGSGKPSRRARNVVNN